MKVTKGYIRNLVMEAISEMHNESNFDFDFWLEQILLAAQDSGIKIKGPGGFPIENGEKPTKGVILANTNGYPVHYELRMLYDADREELGYTFYRIEDATNNNNLRDRKVDYFSADVKSSEAADGFISLIYAFGNKDFKYLEDLAQVLAKDNQNR